MEVKAILGKGKLNHGDPGTVNLMVGLNPPEIREAERKPIDVVVVLDISSSMDDPATVELNSPTKMMLAKQAVRKFVEQLRPGDRVGVVTYDTVVTVLAPLRELTIPHRAQIIEGVGNLSANGSTDLVGGTLRGLSLFNECAASADRTRRVILFTDGLPTAGITEHGQVVAAIRQKLNKDTPISTFGFGAVIVKNGVGDGGYDSELLTSIAKLAGGEFYHADGPDGILCAFAFELGALRSAAATEVKIHLKPGSKLVVREVLNDCTVTTDGGVTTIEVGHLYGGEPFYVVAVLDVPKVDQIFPRDVLACSVRVTGVTTSGALDEQRDAHFRYVKADEADATSDPAVEEQRVRLLAAREVEKAYAMARAGNYAGAAACVRGIAVIAVAVGTQEACALAAGLEEIAGDVGNRDLFAARAGHVRAASNSMHTRRTTGMGYSFGGSYASPAKKKTLQDMGVGPAVPAAPPPPAPPAQPGAGKPDPAPPEPQQGPDKRQSRAW